MAIVSSGPEQKYAIRARARRVIGVFIVGVLIVASMYLYNYVTTANRFAIEKIELSGLSRIDPNSLQPLVTDLKGQNILLAPLDEVEARLQAQPRIARVECRRVLPNRVVYSITEREPVALVYTDRFFEIDAAGMVMPEDSYTGLLDLPTITGIAREDVRAGRMCEDPMVRGALEALRVCRDLGSEFAGNISELRATDTGIAIRSLRDDCVLLLGNGDYERRLRKFFLLRSELARRDEPGKLIDLRFENQVVLRSGF
ncbi:MAG TPA: FtsQ-type POTRA domain-containing protein [Candidatus Krumholzibacteria bacterium]|nr:FtsQ-type POTRA domain-containing protein [Candidatus Krumholzibacteria bacterium]